MGTGRHVKCLFLSRQGVKRMVIKAAWNGAMAKVMEIIGTGFHSEQMREAGRGELSGFRFISSSMKFKATLGFEYVYLHACIGERMATHSSLFAWKTHGWRSLAGPSPWGHKELDTTE